MDSAAPINFESPHVSSSLLLSICRSWSAAQAVIESDREAKKKVELLLKMVKKADPRSESALKYEVDRAARAGGILRNSVQNRIIMASDWFAHTYGVTQELCQGWPSVYGACCDATVDRFRSYKSAAKIVAEFHQYSSSVRREAFLIDKTNSFTGLPDEWSISKYIKHGLHEQLCVVDYASCVDGINAKMYPFVEYICYYHPR